MTTREVMGHGGLWSGVKDRMGLRSNGDLIYDLEREPNGVG